MMYACLAVIYFFICIEYIIECIKGYKSTSTVIGVVILHVAIFLSALAFKESKHSNMEYWVIEAGYVISYVTCIILDITDGAWLYIFPFGCVLLLFFDDLKAVITGILFFSSMGIIAIVIDWNLLNEIEKIRVFQRCLSLIICSLMVLIVAYSLNYVFKELKTWYKESAYDKITGLRSIYYFDEVLRRVIERDDNIQYSLGMIVVHEFYKYNEHSYTYGNSILNTVADKIKDEIRIRGIEEVDICRQSGGRFFIMFYNMDVKSGADICKKIQSTLHRCALHDDKQNEGFIDTNIVITDTDICGHNYKMMLEKLESMLVDIKAGSFIVDSRSGENDNSSSNE